jgi:molybdopterin molybdotransferase/putative molybdopterin biosynthesis protein
VEHQFEVRVFVRERRQHAGMSQGQLAKRINVTRQAISAIESGQYSPSTSIALRLAEALNCKVEELFYLRNKNQLIEAALTAPLTSSRAKVPTKLVRINGQVHAWPLRGSDHLAGLASSADGWIVGSGSRAGRVKVELRNDLNVVDRQIVIAGCDPAISLASEYVERGGLSSVFAATMGSEAALDALLQGRIHVAGLHLVDEETGEINLPYLRRHLMKGNDFLIVTFAGWQEGLIVAQGNPKRIHDGADLERPDVRLANRESGSGARRLLDSQLAKFGIDASQVPGYDHAVGSHLEVAWMIRSGLADVGIGVETAAVAYELDFIPLQLERYDLVLAKSDHENHPGVKAFLDVIVSGAFRAELEALGGYDMSEAGKIWDLKAA